MACQGIRLWFLKKTSNLSKKFKEMEDTVKEKKKKQYLLVKNR